MKRMVMIILLLLLLIGGLVLAGVGGYGYFYSPTQLLCEEGVAELERLSAKPRPSPGTAEEREFLIELNRVNLKMNFCKEAKAIRRTATITALFGLAMSLVSAFVLRSKMRSAA
jgi:hypothetical protein